MPSPNSSKQRKIKDTQLQGFKYFDRLQPLLERLHDDATTRDKAGNRRLFYDQYASLLLLYFFNPVLTSLRGLQQAADLNKVQKLLGVKRASLGSLSEASSIFDPTLLRDMVQELASRAVTLEQGHPRQDLQALQGLTATDGTLLPALPRMMWALWQDEQHRAVKMHLQFDVLKGVPADATVTPGASSEPEQLEHMLQAKRLYVIDRGYAGYPLLQHILDARSSFVARVKNNTAFTIQEERSLNHEARAAGVQRDLVLDKLGASHHSDVLQQPVRLIIVEVTNREGEPALLWLLTDRLEMPAELVALAYRYRWTIELFFRWFKCVLGCRHFLSENANGVTIQCYVALIASLLIVIWTGLHPTKRTWEMLQFYLIGWASLDELEQHLIKRRQPVSTNAIAKP